MSLASETELLRLALMAYEAASEPALWTSFLERYAKTIAADFTVLQIHDLEQAKSVVLQGFGLSSPFTRSYNEYYSKLNLWREHGRAFLTPGRVNLTEEQCPRGVLESSEFYNDYIRHIGSYGLGMVISREGTGVLNPSAQRQKCEYGEAEREIARFLLPHLARACAVHRRLGLLAAGTSVLDGLPYGVVFLSAGGAVVYSNRPAEDIFRANDGLELRSGGCARWTRWPVRGSARPSIMPCFPTAGRLAHQPCKSCVSRCARPTNLSPLHCSSGLVASPACPRRPPLFSSWTRSANKPLARIC